jgi:methyltransferase family protein
MMKPETVVEIGTFFAGTAEVMARALWENRRGVLHTTDPFGASRCPKIIAEWPRPLQNVAIYHTLNSMDFLSALMRGKHEPDLILIDGNHDYEFALFDLQLAGDRLIKPGGIIIMDNAEQSGPFQATRNFLNSRPGWRELGNSIGQYNQSAPFRLPPASIADTSFLILQAPTTVHIGETPRSWGQILNKSNSVGGFVIDGQGHDAGIFHYRVIQRGFGNALSVIDEIVRVGCVDLQPATERFRLKIDLEDAATCYLANQYKDTHYTTEIELAWVSGGAAPSIELTSPPQPSPDLPAV